MPSGYLVHASLGQLEHTYWAYGVDCGQILAGDEIESTFGGRLGLSTLAAAGLGNLLSDLVGLAMAEPIQACIRALQPMLPGPCSGDAGELHAHESIDGLPL